MKREGVRGEGKRSEWEGAKESKRGDKEGKKDGGDPQYYTESSF